jgi:hypothetical protein
MKHMALVLHFHFWPWEANKQAVTDKLVFTTHNEEAGNEKLRPVSCEVRAISSGPDQVTQIGWHMATSLIILTAFKICKNVNACQLHGEVSRKMWVSTKAGN